jgi:hypothetical protein
MGMPDDATLGADFRAWIEWRAAGGGETWKTSSTRSSRPIKRGFLESLLSRRCHCSSRGFSGKRSTWTKSKIYLMQRSALGSEHLLAAFWKLADRRPSWTMARSRLISGSSCSIGRVTGARSAGPRSDWPSTTKSSHGARVGVHEIPRISRCCASHATPERVPPWGRQLQARARPARQATGATDRPSHSV